MPKEKIGTRKANGTGNSNKRPLWTEIVHQQCDLDLLQQEIQYGQRMMEKHKGHWRTMLIKIAMPQMRKDLEYSWSCYERAVENKDFMISILLDDLRMAEEQTLMCANVHMDNINYITVLCHDQIVELNQESIQLIRKLYTAGTFEVTYMQTTSQEHKEYMRMMLYILNEIGRETSKTMHGLSLTQEMLRKEKFLLVQQQLVDELTVRLRRMGAEIEAVLDHCIKQFEVRKKKYAEMERSDLEAQVVIRQNWERIHRCNESIKILQRRYAFLQSTQAKRIVDLRLEAAYFAKFFTALKQRVREELDMDGVAIRTLVAKSGKVIAALKAFEHRGEKLLKMVELCRKLETLEEKIMQFPLAEQTVLTDKELNKLMKMDEECTDTSNNHIPFMALFWRRLAASEASRFMLKEQCISLRQKNKHLHLQINKYCECFECHAHSRMDSRMLDVLPIRSSPSN